MEKSKNAYYDNFSFAGKICYNLTMAWAHFLVNHRILYYILSYTWGILTTLFGLAVTLALLCAGKKPTAYHWIYYFRVGSDYWGGFSAGSTFLRDQRSADSAINPHEFGHTFQNTLFGPFAIFISYIPSIIRYWTREAQSKKGESLPPYDSVWFEASATDAGTYAVKLLDEQARMKEYEKTYLK